MIRTAPPNGWHDRTEPAPDSRRGGAVDAPSGPPPRVAVLASTDLLAEALAALLCRHDILASAADGWGLATGPAPDVVLLCADGQAMDAQVLRLRRDVPLARIVLIVAEADLAMVEHAQRLTVDGLLDGQSRGAELAHAILRIAEGRRVFPVTVTVSGPATQLSRRQLDVLRLVAQGRSNGEIARELVITINTVKFHVRTIFRELGIHNRVSAARAWGEMQTRSNLIG